MITRKEKCLVLSADSMGDLPLLKTDYEAAAVIFVRGVVVKNTLGPTTSEAREQALDTVNPVLMGRTIQGIAQLTLGLSTLDARMSDRLDFHSMGVVSIRRALEEAYAAGKASKDLLPYQEKALAAGKGFKVT